MPSPRHPRILPALAATIAACTATAQPVPVTLAQTPEGYTLLRDGQPYFIKGVGGRSRLDLLAASGANSFRTWNADHAQTLLDQAHAHGLTVAMGLWLEHERHGFDYDDPAQRQAQLDKFREAVTAHKDHPALLLWGIGNEVELEGDIDKALRFVEEVAAMVKSIDPNHPTMAVIAEIGGGKAALIAQRCPSIDIVGINSYAGLASLPQRLTEQGYTGPYIVTEFGVPGHWEVGKAPWGAPFEPSSAEKAAAYEANYRGGILADHPGRCLGSYAFLWGHKQETTATWFGMFLPSGESAPTVDTMTRLWSGSPPANRAPDVHAIDLGAEGLTFRPGATLRVTAQASEPDGDPMDFSWQLLHESSDRRSGGDAEARPDAVPAAFSDPDGPAVTLTLPTEPGPYRLFLVVRDGKGHAGTANTPLLVE